MSKYHRFYVIFFLFLAQTFIPIPVVPVKAEGNCCDMNWSKSKTITVFGSTVGNLTNYPVKVILHNTDGSDYDNHMRARYACITSS